VLKLKCSTFVDTVVGVGSGKSFRGVMNVMNTDISKYGTVLLLGVPFIGCSKYNNCKNLDMLKVTAVQEGFDHSCFS